MSELEVYHDLGADLMKHGPLFGDFQEVPWIVSASWFKLTQVQLNQLQDLGPVLGTFLRACDALYYEDANVRRVVEQGKPQNIIERQKALREAGGPILIRPDIVITQEGLKIAEIETIVGGLGMYSQIKDSYQTVIPPQDGSTPYPGSITQSFIDTASALPGEGRIILTPSFNSRYFSDLSVFSALCAERGYEAVPVPANRVHEVGKDQAKGIWRLFEIYEVDQLVAIPEVPIYPPLKQFTEEKAWLAFLHASEYEDYWVQALGIEGFRLLRQSVSPTWIMRSGMLPKNVDELKKLSKGQRRFVTKQSGYSEDSWGARSFTYWPDKSTNQWQHFLGQALNQPGTPYVMQEYQDSLQYSVPALVNGKVEQMNGLRAKLSPFYFFNNGKTELADIGVILRRSKKVHGATDSIRLPVSIT